MNKHCPVCEKEDVRRTQAQGFLEEKLFPLIRLWPYRCQECRNRFYGFSLQNGMQDRKRVKRRKRKTQQEEQFPQFFKPADDKEFEKLIAEISEAERRVFGKREEDETDPKVERLIR